jgi:hypothetical protein
LGSLVPVAEPASSASTGTSAASASTVKSTAAAETAASGLSRSRFIHVKRAASKLCAIHTLNGPFCFFIVRHFHKSKAPRLASITVFEDGDIIDLAIGPKGLAQFVFRHFEVEIAYIDVFHAFLLLLLHRRAILAWLQVLET